MAEETIIRFDVEARVAWRATRDPASDRWVGISDDLRLTVEADTWEDLQEEMAAALDMLLRDLLEEGELTRFLRDHGWRPVTRLSMKQMREKDVRFDLPFTVVPQRRFDDLPAALHQ